jgi:hypothetical protein
MNSCKGRHYIWNTKINRELFGISLTYSYLCTLKIFCSATYSNSKENEKVQKVVHGIKKAARFTPLSRGVGIGVFISFRDRRLDLPRFRL